MKTNANSLYKKLEGLFEKKTAQNKAFTIWKLVNLKHKEGQSVSGHLSEFQNLVIN